MPGTATTKYSLPTMAGTDLINQVDEWTVAFGAAVDPLLAPSDQGLLASRPVSTGGSPGKVGRTYMATDVGVLFRDNGTGWDTVLTGVGHAALLGLNTDGVVRRGKSIVSATETRTNAAYGLMTTPDRVQNIVLSTDGMIFIAYSAQWAQSVLGAARAAIFIGANQVQCVDKPAASGPGAQSAAIPTPTGAVTDLYVPLHSWPLGLLSGATRSGDVSTGAPVTTGQVVGASHRDTGNVAVAGMDIAGQFIDVSNTPSGTWVYQFHGGICAVFAAAGTYDVSVQFKAASGNVAARNRKLWVWTQGF